MKFIKLMTAILAGSLAAMSCGPKKADAPKVLVLYYSQTSNTGAVARQIADLLGADIEEIKAVEPYDGDFQATIQRCLQEREEGKLPEIHKLSSDLGAYDYIFLGYPVWFGTYAPPVITLLGQIDLAGKKVVPFCTFGSGGLESSVKDLAQAQPEAEILPGYGVRAARMAAVPAELDRFLKELGLLEGEVEELPAFSEKAPVTDAESAVFDAAVDGYPMLNARAKEFEHRLVPGGEEYIFTAEQLPREGGPAVPPGGDVYVYVRVEEGQAPVFTKVVR